MRLGTGALIIVLALGLVAALSATDAQQPEKIPRIGVLVPMAAPEAWLGAFRKGLRDLGYVEGRNIAIEWRATEGKQEPARAADRLDFREGPLCFARVLHEVDLVLT